MISILTSRFRDKKKFIINYLILLCSCFFIILSFYLLNYFEYCVNKSLNKSIENKMIMVDYFDTFDKHKIDKICNLNYIVDCYEEYSNWEFIVDGYNLLLDNHINNNHSILYGRLIKKTYEVIVSNYIVDNMDYELGDNILYNDIELKIVGIVDSDLPYVYGDNETVRHISNFNNGMVSNVILVVDKYENTLDVMNKLDDIGYDSAIVGNVENSKKNMKDIVESLKFGIYIIVFISIIIIFAVFLHINNCEKKNGALLRLLGYSNIFITLMGFLYELILCVLVFVFYLFFYLFISCLFSLFEFYVVCFDIYLRWLLFILVVIVCTSLINFVFRIFKSKRINAIHTIEES